jgi:hypothetical protein
VIEDISMTVANDSLTLSAKGSIAKLDNLVNAAVTATIFYDGRTDMTVEARAINIGSFSLAQSVVRVTNDNPDRLYTATITGFVGVEGVYEAMKMEGFINADGDYALTAKDNLSVGDLTFCKGEFTLTKENGLFYKGVMGLPGLSEVEFKGNVLANGDYALTGALKNGIGGFSFGNGEFTLTKRDGLRFEGTMGVPGLPGTPQVAFQGAISANGSYHLSGSLKDQPIAGFNFPEAKFTLTNQGLSFEGAIRFPVIDDEITLKGDFQSDGTFRLKADEDFSLAGFRFSQGHLELTNDGLRIGGSVNLPGLSRVAFTGDLESNGYYSLTGKLDGGIREFPVADGSFTLTKDDGLQFAGRMRVPGLSGATISLTSKPQLYGINWSPWHRRDRTRRRLPVRRPVSPVSQRQRLPPRVQLLNGQLHTFESGRRMQRSAQVIGRP